MCVRGAGAAWVVVLWVVVLWVVVLWVVVLWVVVLWVTPMSVHSPAAGGATCGDLPYLSPA